ncbi:MAG TPA: flagellar biosynthetic protein FliP, partial [Brevundimonas sp.]|nr:flagellar biosynthetic protein FliP [Brevundimonas sp.]
MKRPAVFAMPTRAELKRAALLSLITTALCL